jgi:exonuclease SbcC
VRPETLVVEGFSAFRNRTEVDFRGADLFAFSGPTGAGKSSLIDAMIFALYGSVPRLQNKNLVAPVISQQAAEARVLFRFNAGGRHFQAARVVRADGKGGATTKEARLEEVDGAGEVLEVRAGDADGVGAAVSALLGLSYDHFVTCVVLPQGEFARFLHNTPSQRQDLLVRLLDLGIFARMASLAGSRSKAAGDRAELLASRLARHADLTPHRRTALAARADQLEALVAAIDATRDRRDAIEARHVAASASFAAATDAAQLLAGVAAPGDVARIASAVTAADRALAEAEAAALEAETAADAAQQAHAALPAAAELRARLEAHGRLAELRTRLRKGEEVVAARNAEVVGAAAAVATAADASAQAEAALEHARTADLVAAVSAGLAAGDPCPVCRTPLADHPAAGDGGAALAAARRALDGARRRHLATQDTLGAVRDAQARAASQFETLTEQARELETALAGAPPADALEQTLAQVHAAAEQANQARDALAAARRARAAARDAATAAATAASAGWLAFDTARDRVARHGPPAAARTDLGAAWRALCAWAEGERALHEATAAAAGADRDAAEAEMASLVDTWVAAAATAGVTVGDRTVRDVVVEARSQADSDLAAFDRDRAEADELEADAARAREAAQVAGTAARFLNATNFQKWLLDEAVRRLVLGASATLQQLSSGGYSLVAGRSGFDVIDHRNADLVRSSRTLSGGETFLASLSLALALADQVVDLAAGGGARLESIFLDEGFGTLDAETLEVVASAIEELGSNGRTVGIVSHVKDLAERLPVRFEVRRDAGGSTVRRVGG